MPVRLRLIVRDVCRRATVSETIQISSTDGDFYQLKPYPLTNAKIYVDNSIPGEAFIRILIIWCFTEIRARVSRQETGYR